MGKIILSIFLVWLALFGCCFAQIPVNDFIPKGWDAGNGFSDDVYPYFIKTNIYKNTKQDILLHYSHKNKGEYLPDKHAICMLSWDGQKYLKRWAIGFNSIENIFFFAQDINKDGTSELIVHGLHSGNAANGLLWIYSLGNSNPKKLFEKDIQGECYLWSTEKLICGINPEYFPDLNHDGIKEVIIGFSGNCTHTINFHCSADEPWWFDVYKWNGKTYVLADNKFPEFYKEQLDYYKSFVKEKGRCEVVDKFAEKALKYSNSKSKRG